MTLRELSSLGKVLLGGIRFSVVKNRPVYAIDSVDHALQLAQLLRHEGPLGVSEAAERLGVARSTAHRLLAMLVYRDFAVQGQDRRYHPGPALQPSPADTRLAGLALLRRVALPRLQALVARLDETANLQVRAGNEVRFLASVQCDRVLRVGDREGRVLPANEASGGKVLLAALSDEAVAALYADRRDGVDVPSLLAELARVRKRGFAINDQVTEDGVTAVGVPVRGVDGAPVAGLTLAMPSARFRRSELTTYVSALNGCALGIQQDLIEASV